MSDLKNNPREVAVTLDALLDVKAKLAKTPEPPKPTHLDDTITIVEGPGPGLWTAQATRDGRTAGVVLPRGFQSWTVDEIKAHFRRFIAPKLKAELDQGGGTLAEEAPVGQADVIRIEKAREKRAQRAAKLAEREHAQQEEPDDQPE